MELKLMKFLFQPCNFPCPGLQQRTSANHRWSWGPEPTFEVNISDHFSWTLLSPKLLSGILWVTWSKRRLLELLVCRTGEEEDEIIFECSWDLCFFLFRETEQSGVLYAFPPCAFSMDLLRRSFVYLWYGNHKYSSWSLDHRTSPQGGWKPFWWGK